MIYRIIILLFVVVVLSAATTMDKLALKLALVPRQEQEVCELNEPEAIHQIDNTGYGWSYYVCPHKTTKMRWHCTECGEIVPEPEEPCKPKCFEENP